MTRTKLRGAVRSLHRLAIRDIRPGLTRISWGRCTDTPLQNWLAPTRVRSYNPESFKLGGGSATAARKAADRHRKDRISLKALVIGSNSFSGSHLVSHCLNQGWQVYGVSRSEEIHPVFRPYQWPTTNKTPDCPSRGCFEFHQIDLNHQLSDLVDLIATYRPDYVFNYTAQGMVAQSWEAPVDWFRTNTLSMVALHHQLRCFDFIKAFVQASTPEVYGSTATTVHEDFPFNPSTPYAISKAACDMNLLALARTFGFPAILTRSANVCGPGQQLFRILPRTIFAALTGEKLTLDGGGLSERAFIHIDDVCEGTLQAALKGKPGDIFHLSTGVVTTIRQVVEKICQALAVPFEEVVQLGPPRVGLDAAYLLSSAKAQEQLGWRCHRDLNHMIDDTVTWVKNNLEDLKLQPLRYEHKP